VTGSRYVSAFGFHPHDRDKVYAVLNCQRIFTSINAGASFTESGTFPDGCVRNLLVDPQNPNVMYAATDGGVFRSPDHGATWTIESGIPHAIVSDLAIDSSANKVYAAVRSSGVFATFDSFDATPVPALILDSTEYCLGQSWSLKVSGAQADTTMRLFGVSNAQVWEIAAWNTTDANGRYEDSGTFSRGTEGRHMLYVEIDGASSNDVSFRVSNCTP
jgi:hypothetical protein